MERIFSIEYSYEILSLDDKQKLLNIHKKIKKNGGNVYSHLDAIENKFRKLDRKRKRNLLLLTKYLLEYQNRHDNNFDKLFTDNQNLIILYNENPIKFDKQTDRKCCQIVSHTYVNNDLFNEVLKFIDSEKNFEDLPPIIEKHLNEVDTNNWRSNLNSYHEKNELHGIQNRTVSIKHGYKMLSPNDKLELSKIYMKINETEKYIFDEMVTVEHIYASLNTENKRRILLLTKYLLKYQNECIGNFDLLNTKNQRSVIRHGENLEMFQNEANKIGKKDGGIISSIYINSKLFNEVLKFIGNINQIEHLPLIIEIYLEKIGKEKFKKFEMPIVEPW